MARIAGPCPAGEFRQELGKGVNAARMPFHIGSGLRLTFYEEEHIDLEDAFMRLTQGIVS